MANALKRIRTIANRSRRYALKSLLPRTRLSTFLRPNILHPDQYWSPNFFWPIRNTLSWSDHLLGPSVLYGVFRFFLDPFQSYVSWLILTLSLNYISIRVAVQRIAPKTASIWISIIALATAFSPAIIQQLGHPQLEPLLDWTDLVSVSLIQSQAKIFGDIWLGLASWILSIGFSIFISCLCMLWHINL